MNNKKRIGAGAVLLCAAVICTIIACVLYIVNSNGSYYHDFSTKIVYLTIVCVALELVILIAGRIRGEKIITDACYVVTSVLLVATAMQYIAVRVESAGTILGSTLEADNAAAMPALMQAFVGIGLFILAMILVSVSGGFNLFRDEKTVEQTDI